MQQWIIGLENSKGCLPCWTWDPIDSRLFSFLTFLSFQQLRCLVSMISPIRWTEVIFSRSNTGTSWPMTISELVWLNFKARGLYHFLPSIFQQLLIIVVLANATNHSLLQFLIISEIDRTLSIWSVLYLILTKSIPPSTSQGRSAKH